MGTEFNDFFFQLRSKMYEEYEHILFESNKEGYDGVYKEQVKNIEKFFNWDFICKNLSNDNIKEYYTIQKMKLSDVLDYLVVCKQQNQVNEWKNSKNSIAI